MEFSTTRTKQIIPAHTYESPAAEYTIAEVRGPCLVCEREIGYKGRWPYDEDHARKQFKPKRREQMLHKLRSNEWDGGNVPQVQTIEGMVCAECRTECKGLRDIADRQRKEEHRQRQTREKERERMVGENRLARERHYEWREATKKEVDPTPQSAEFRAVFANFEMPDIEVHKILFRWRATPGKCRGDSYLMKVGMWVDGRLTAHYYGWDLQDFPANRPIDFPCSEDEWPTQDLFAQGFCRWIERAFQPRLLKLVADQTWTPGQYGAIETVGRKPSTLRIEWLDGSVYVHLLPALDLPDVAEWAEKHLELTIEERAFRPVRRPAPEVDEDE